MSALKDQDPDYGPSVVNNEKHQRIYQENARSSTARKITAIIEKQFSQEISTKEKEVLEIQERLHRASKTLHLLRYVIVADFYNRKQCQASHTGEARQTQIHPAIKRLIGKSPKGYDGSASTSASSNGSYFTGSPSSSSSLSSTIECDVPKSEKPVEEIHEHHHTEKRNLVIDEESRPRKVPRYVPPKSGLPESPCPSRGIRHKVRKRIIIGNISKWIPPEWREDAASHKWTMYVRGNKENPDIDDFVGKVRFFLHPSYRPNDVVEITSAPFCLSRRGWGEFPLRVQLHFKSALNKPMDIIHHLKLDRTYTGLQTLGSETLVDIWIYAESRNSKRNASIESFDEDSSRPEAPSADNCSETKEEIPLCENTSLVPGTTDSSIKTWHEPTIKLESTEDNKNDDENNENVGDLESKDLTSIERLRFQIDLDHDYFGSKYLNRSKERNWTIEHSSVTSNSTGFSPDKTSEENFEQEEKEVAQNKSVVSLQPFENGASILKEEGTFESEVKVNCDFSHMVREKGCDLPTEASTFTTNKLDRGSKMSMAGPSTMKFQSNLRPLKITIPPLFETCGSKRVLVLQNNKTIPVDITVPRSDEFARKTGGDATRSKANLAIPRGISLLKKPLGSEEAQTALKIKPSASILLNVNSNVPALKIADVSNLRNELPPPPPPAAKEIALERQPPKSENQEESKELKTVRPKITVGKDKYKLQSRKDVYDEVFRVIEIAKITDIRGLLRFIVRRLPIVTRDASDPDYRRIHPYACTTEEEFFSYGVAKRRACEWNRAKMVRCFLKKKSFAEEELWTVKEILIWARLHGYTPVCAFSTIRPMDTNGIKNLPDSASVRTVFTCTEPIAFHKWLRTCPYRSNDLSLDTGLQRTDEVDEIDVVEVENSVAVGNKKRNSGGGENEELADSKVTVLELEKKLIPLQNFVCETAREIGIKLISEEIAPSVVYCAASRMIMQAAECFVDDLVRMSLAKAWERCSDDGYPKVVALDDVQRALLNREEFDIFTNEGLGSKYRLAAMD